MNDLGLNLRHERERLQALGSYHILETAPEVDFDNITALAAQLLGVPVAVIAFVDSDQIWFKSKYGIEMDRIWRGPGFCADAINASAPHIVTDASLDPRCKDNPLVTEKHGIRFYAGIPLLSPNHYGLGTLCVLDFKPRQISEAEINILKSLADIVMTQLEMRSSIIRSQEIGNRFRLLFEKTTDAMLLLDPETGYFVDWNPAAMKMLGYTKKQPFPGLRPSDISPEYQPDGRRSNEKAIEIINLALDNGSHHCEWTIHSQHCDPFPVDVLLTTLMIADKRMLILIWRDITQQKLAEKELHEGRIRWEFALEGSGDGVWDWNIPESTVHFSRRWKEILGYAEDEIGNSLNEWSDRVHPEDMERVMHDVNVHIQERTPYYTNEHRTRCKDGTYKWILARGRVVSYDSAGRPERMVGTQTDITENKMALQALADAESSQRALLTAMADGVFVAQDYRFVFCNPALPEMLGYTVDEFVGMEFKDVIDREFLGLWTERFKQRISGNNPSSHYQVRLKTKEDGKSIWVELIASRMEFQGRPGVLGIIRNISEKKKTEELIWKQANYDALTSLPNRHMFLDRLDQEIKKEHRTGHRVGLIFIDLDHFKEVNDTMGHDFGDVLLQQSAKRLTHCVRAMDTVARLGGDEFTVILTDIENNASIERVAHNILESISEPFLIDNEHIYISASIGITLYPNDATNSEELIKNADQAMYDAKKLGRNRYSYFTKSMQETAKTRMTIANDMRVALKENQLHLVYQPIINLVSGKIVKAESLLRWDHPTRGLISPVEFIPIAEETGMIIDIGEWVFIESAKQAQIWREKIDPHFQVSVNKSPVQFRNKSEGYRSFAQILRKMQLSGNLAVVEITESMLLEADDLAKEKLRELREAGMQIAIDDFGTGYSSLSYLKKFDIDYLKIDRSFISELSEGSDDLALCEAIIMMAHCLGIKVIAEGIETEEQKDLLVKAGCDYGQGFFFSRPVKAAEFEALLLDPPQFIPCLPIEPKGDVRSFPRHLRA